jgi:ribosomal 30S subunit maturation factor RimM
VLLPFSDAAVPEVDLAAGTITVVIPPADTATDAQSS